VTRSIHPDPKQRRIDRLRHWLAMLSFEFELVQKQNARLMALAMAQHAQLHPGEPFKIPGAT